MSKDKDDSHRLLNPKEHAGVTSQLDRDASAVHEAGHAVMAYHVGWWVNHEGVEIDDRQYTGMRCHAHDHNEWRIAWTSLVGWLAEHRWHRRGERLQSVDDITDCIELARDGDKEELDEIGGDMADILRVLVKHYPTATDEALIETFREYEQKVWDELKNAPLLWQSIIDVATALSAKGQLTAKEVEAIFINGGFEYIPAS